MSAETSKVIIVGGGPIGLTTALALTKAGIDFILLEQKSTVVNEGGNDLFLQLGAMRALGQLGVFDALCLASSPISAYRRMDRNRQSLGDISFFEYMKRDFGTYPRIVHRKALLKVLFEALPESAQANCFTKKKLEGIKIVKNGVIASCTDGTSYTGSLVIGADGPHSAVRQSMDAIRSSSQLQKLPSPFLASYRAVWVRVSDSLSKSLEQGATIETHGQSASTQLFITDKGCAAILYERLDVPTPESKRYSETDMDAVVGRWANLPLSRDSNLTFGEVYLSRKYGIMVDLEEGVVKEWTLDDRVVLVGDSAHKYTPTQGSGGNVGIIDVVVLVNKLHEIRDILVGNAATSGTPEAEDQEGPEAAALSRQHHVAQALKAYEVTRVKEVEAGCLSSGQATAMSTWKTTLLWLMDRYVLPFQMIQKLLFNGIASRISKVHSFDFLPGDYVFSGKIPWPDKS